VELKQDTREAQLRYKNGKSQGREMSFLGKNFKGREAGIVVHLIALNFLKNL
jgi:hypothetical protein